MWGSIVKALLYVLNPLNWPAIGAVFAALIGSVRLVIDWLVKMRQEKAMKELADAIERVRTAKDVDEKTKAGCDVEKIFNPDSDCGHGHGD